MRAQLGSEEGFLMVEVLISTLLVALIVFATFNGFDVANRLSADQRRHDLAAVLAAQSQEQLRSDPATALDALTQTSRSFTRSVNSTTFTITQQAWHVGSSGQTTGCKASETGAQTGANFEVTSSVTWALLVAANRPAVKQSSIISPPTGSAIEVDVTNGSGTGIPGVTALARFIPVASGTYSTVEGTTGTAGCVVLSGLQATSATVEIGEKPNYVTATGALKWPTREVQIAPNITTHYPVTYAEGGRITAKYSYKGASEWEGKTVVGDTFVVFNTSMSLAPEFEVGSTAFEYEKGGEEHYKALTSTYSATASTAAGSKYLTGDLFPFASPAKWQAYAGDCTKNSLATVTASTEKLSNEAGLVEAGKTTVVSVPLSYVALSLWTGATSGSKGALAKEHLGPVKVTNSECASSATPNNATALVVAHEQKETSLEGHLEDPFQPFGAFELCVYDKALKRTYTTKYTNNTTAGSAPQIYLGELTATERATAETAAATAKATREREEREGRGGSSGKTKRQTEETEATAAKTKRTEEAATGILVEGKEAC